MAGAEELTTPWRLGRNVPINVYEGDRPICQCHTAIDAKQIVDAMNKSAAMQEALEAVERYAGNEEFPFTKLVKAAIKKHGEKI